MKDIDALIQEWERIEEKRYEDKLTEQEYQDWRRELEEDMQAEDNYEKENTKVSSVL